MLRGLYRRDLNFCFSVALACSKVRREEKQLLRKEWDIINPRRTGKGTLGQWGVVDTTFTYFSHKQIKSTIRVMHEEINSLKEGCLVLKYSLFFRKSQSCG